MAAVPIADSDYLTAAPHSVRVLGNVLIREMTVASNLQTILARIVRLPPHLDGDSSVPVSWETHRNEAAFFRGVVSAMPSGPVLPCIKAHVGLEPQVGTDHG
jgi:hypothetical protein